MLLTILYIRRSSSAKVRDAELDTARAVAKAVSVQRELTAAQDQIASTQLVARLEMRPPGPFTVEEFAEELAAYTQSATDSSIETIAAVIRLIESRLPW